MLVLASNCLFDHRLRSCIYCLGCLETIYQQHFFDSTDECGIKECGTKECGINFCETAFNSQT